MIITGKGNTCNVIYFQIWKLSFWGNMNTMRINNGIVRLVSSKSNKALWYMGDVLDPCGRFNIRIPHGRISFMMGIPLPGKRSLYRKRTLIVAHDISFAMRSIAGTRWPLRPSDDAYSRVEVPHRSHQTLTWRKTRKRHRAKHSLPRLFLFWLNSWNNFTTILLAYLEFMRQECCWIMVEKVKSDHFKMRVEEKCGPDAVKANFKFRRVRWKSRLCDRSNHLLVPKRLWWCS